MQGQMGPDADVESRIAQPQPAKANGNNQTETGKGKDNNAPQPRTRRKTGNTVPGHVTEQTTPSPGRTKDTMCTAFGCEHRERS